MSRFKLLVVGLVAGAVVAASVTLVWPRVGAALLGLVVVAAILQCLEQLRAIRRLQTTMNRNDREFHRLQMQAIRAVATAPSASAVSGKATTPSQSETPAASSTSALSGRAATPEVSNASTEMTLTAALDGRRDRQGVIGVFGDHCREQLVESGFTVVELRRGSAVSMVGQTEAPTLVIDEDAFHSGQWWGALDATGTGAAQELRAALAAASGRGLLCLLVPATTRTPSSHQRALRTNGVRVLPLDEAGWAEAAGARLGPSPLPVLHEVAAQRVGAAQ